jgi:Ca2+-transporting ATPase
MAYSDDLPLAPLQILWLNIVVHIFPALALAMGGDGEDNSTGPSGILISTRTWSEIGWRAATVAGGGLAALLVSQARGEAAEHGQAMVFATIAFGLVGQSFLIGVHTPGAHLARLRRTGLWLAVAISTLFLLAAMWLPGLKAALDLATITGQDWAVVAVAVAGAWALGQAGSLILARVADGARRSGARVQENRA